MRFVIRPLAPDEVDGLVSLCAEHAAYERAPFAAVGKAEALTELVFGRRPRLHVLVGLDDGALAGYASWSEAVSTWRARTYLHMDCLYVRAAYRGRGLGAHLLRVLVATCARDGLDHLEWQSPAWNAGALRFYRRQGASGLDKVRFSLPAPVGQGVAATAPSAASSAS